MTKRTDPIWEELDDLAWREFARAWLGEQGGPSFDGAVCWPVALFGGLVSLEDVGQAVVAMNFTARAELQWKFIEVALDQVTTSEELERLAAGPIEHLLGWHGPAFIERIEFLAARSRKLAKAVSAVQRYRISDEVWARVRAIQATHEAHGGH